jgi:hypothetical protein
VSDEQHKRLWNAITLGQPMEVDENGVHSMCVVPTECALPLTDEPDSERCTMADGHSGPCRNWGAPGPPSIKAYVPAEWQSITLDGSAQAAESRPSLRRRLWRWLMAWLWCRRGHHGREDGQGRCLSCGKERDG